MFDKPPPMGYIEPVSYTHLIYRFYSDIICRKTGPLDGDTQFLLEMYCRGSIQMTAQWAVSGMKRSPAQMVELLIESMPERLEVLLRDLGTQ